VAIGREAIRRGLEDDRDWSPPHDQLPPVLLRPGAAFVTLRRHGDLLGCIGSMEPRRALADDVAANALSAAFADPRLPAVTIADFDTMSVKVSVLGPLGPLDVASIAELSRSVQIGVDGLLIVAGRRRATFLPSVWEQVGDAPTFLGMLWQKAGLRDGDWPRRLQVFRYQTIEFGDAVTS
jgi:AmmeMemoRadiSam system protein A